MKWRRSGGTDCKWLNQNQLSDCVVFSYFKRYYSSLNGLINQDNTSFLDIRDCELHLNLYRLGIWCVVIIMWWRLEMKVVVVASVPY